MATNTEIWKPIPNFPGYDVSDRGRVRSYHQRIGKHEWIIAKNPQRILKGGVTGRRDVIGRKYPIVTLSQNSKLFTLQSPHISMSMSPFSCTTNLAR